MGSNSGDHIAVQHCAMSLCHGEKQAHPTNDKILKSLTFNRRSPVKSTPPRPRGSAPFWCNLPDLLHCTMWFSACLPRACATKTRSGDLPNFAKDCQSVVCFCLCGTGWGFEISLKKQRFSNSFDSSACTACGAG